MAAEYSLEIITKEGVVFSGGVTSLVAHGAEGYLGILAGHAPLATLLVPGNLVVRDANGRTLTYDAGEGFMEVSDNKAIVLVDSVEGPNGAE